MIIIIGVFLIFLGFLFDEVTTLIVCSKGLCILESNPIYTYFGNGWIYSLCIAAFYILLTWFWIRVNVWYSKAYAVKPIGWKVYDIFVFLVCFLIVLQTTTKLEMGYNNINMLIELETNPPYAITTYAHAYELKELARTDYAAYKSSQDSYYFTDLSYLQVIFSGLFSYLLFRIGYKVRPYASEN